MPHAAAGVLFEGDISGGPLSEPGMPQPPGPHDPWVSAGRIHLASDPGRQRRLAAERPPHLPRAADLRPKLLLVRTHFLAGTRTKPFCSPPTWSESALKGLLMHNYLQQER